MSAQIKESDWKVFKDVRPVALERFCKRILLEIRRTADDESRTAHQRYLATYNLIERRDKEIADAFNDFRRSTAFFQIGIMYSRGLIEDGELARFSSEMQDLLETLYSRKQGS